MVLLRSSVEFSVSEDAAAASCKAVLAFAFWIQILSLAQMPAQRFKV